MGDVVALSDRSGWQTGHGICLNCLAAFVQVQPADAPSLSECLKCHRMAVRFATVRELQLIKARSNIERVLEKPTGYRVEVYGHGEAMAILTGTLVDDILTAILRDRLQHVGALLRDEVDITKMMSV